MSRRVFAPMLMMFVTLVFVSPLHAQEAAAAGRNPETIRWAIITAGFALAIAAAFGALGQSRAIAAAAQRSGVMRSCPSAAVIRATKIGVQPRMSELLATLVRARAAMNRSW